MPHPSDLASVIAIARAAGNLIRERAGNVERLSKRDDEAVTEVDRASQRLIISALYKQWPDDGVIGEENDSGTAITNQAPRRGGRVWVIDPIDGTNNFVTGFGNFAVCIGLLEDGFPTLGVVYDVMRNQMYAAKRGHGAWLDDRPIRVASTPLTSRSLLMLTSNFLDAQGRMAAYAARWHAQTRLKIRVLGTSALEAVLVAAGVAHAAVTINGKLWDIAAAAAVVIEAGGLITDLGGAPLFPLDVRGYAGEKLPFLVAAPAAHAELLADIQRG